MASIIGTVTLGGKAVGRINLETKTFSKQVKKSVHFFWKYRGWGINNSIIEAIRPHGIERIEIHEVEEDIIYSCPLSDYDEYGVMSDEGQGKQVFLNEIHFAKSPATNPVHPRLDLGTVDA